MYNIIGGYSLARIFVGGDRYICPAMYVHVAVNVIHTHHQIKGRLVGCLAGAVKTKECMFTCMHTHRT